MQAEIAILYCVYHDLDTEERSREVLDVLTRIGNVVVVSPTRIGVAARLNDATEISTPNGYIGFLLASCRSIIAHRRFNCIVLHDNYTSILVLFSKIVARKAKIVFDSSEFYPLSEIMRTDHSNIQILIKDFILRFMERITMRSPDLVIAANGQRARAMKEYYKLKRSPVVYDNVHRIADDVSMNMESKYSNYFQDKSVFTLIYAGGISHGRETFKIADSIAALGSGYRLIVVGNATEKSRREFQKRYSYCKEINVFYFGFISRAELRYLYEKGDVGVSAFAKTSSNNIYCASGKLYECLFLGKPILCSANPPLEDVCSEFGVGIASDDYIRSIKQLKENYKYFQDNAKAFCEKYDYMGRYDRLAMSIKEALG